MFIFWCTVNDISLTVLLHTNTFTLISWVINANTFFTRKEISLPVYSIRLVYVMMLVFVSHLHFIDNWGCNLLYRCICPSDCDVLVLIQCCRSGVGNLISNNAIDCINILRGRSLVLGGASGDSQPNEDFNCKVNASFIWNEMSR